MDKVNIEKNEILNLKHDSHDDPSAGYNLLNISFKNQPVIVRILPDWLTPYVFNAIVAGP